MSITLCVFVGATASLLTKYKYICVCVCAFAHKVIMCAYLMKMRERVTIQTSTFEWSDFRFD